MQTFIESMDYQPASWKAVAFRSPQGRKTKRTASVTCECGRVYGLREGEVAKDGTVQSILACQCGFEDKIRLMGWEADAEGGVSEGRPAQLASVPTILMGG